MPSSSQYAVRIAAPATAGPLSRVRKQFNSLVKKLEAERARLALLREEIPKLRALADQEYRPLSQTFDAHRKQLLVLLDQAHSDRTIGKKDKKKLVVLICSMAVELMQAGEDDDELIKALYNKHSGRDFDQDREEEEAFMRRMVADMTGVELDDDADPGSPAALFKAMQEEMAGRWPGQEQVQPGRPAKPAKISAREAKRQAEETRLKQSVRDIFRKLASALHPDRETEPTEQKRKTALMQRANSAYAANDLLGLLELQLEVDQIDQASMDDLGDDRIRQYNRILESQVSQIGNELSALQNRIAIDMGWAFIPRNTSKAMMETLRTDIAGMQAKIRAIEDDLAAFVDIRKLKLWLKNYRLIQDEPMADEFYF